MNMLYTGERSEIVVEGGEGGHPCCHGHTHTHMHTTTDRRHESRC